jgi:uncharacterized protein YndB with AHSA1/START domain
MDRTMTMPDNYLLHVHQEIQIEAPPAVVFDAIIYQVGPGGTYPDGKPMQTKFEAWPGGRWYRDLGNNAGHFWGHVQVIKPPNLLEITGPMFMSYPVASHIQYRLTEKSGGTLLSLTHRAIGDIAPEHRENVGKGWKYILEQIKAKAVK